VHHKPFFPPSLAPLTQERDTWRWQSLLQTKGRLVLAHPFFRIHHFSFPFWAAMKPPFSFFPPSLGQWRLSIFVRVFCWDEIIVAWPFQVLNFGHRFFFSYAFLPFLIRYGWAVPSAHESFVLVQDFTVCYFLLLRLFSRISFFFMISLVTLLCISICIIGQPPSFSSNGNSHLSFFNDLPLPFLQCVFVLNTATPPASVSPL